MDGTVLGTVLGNIFGIAYYIYFQIVGLSLIGMVFRKEKTLHKLLLGSVTGSLLLTWLPILFSFFLDFTVAAHMLALVVTLPVLGLAGYRHVTGQRTASPLFKEHGLFLLLLALFMVFWCYLLHTHTILPNENGGIYTGQCTYGDMNMHLGFITSLAVQQTFPPDYSIMPGVKLSYPVLSDSISSSLYLLGSSLRVAYILPMIFAMAQIFTTVYLFANTLFASLKKSMLVLVFFFLNGGLGFVYFIDWASEKAYQFSDIFTGYYTTPTNLVDFNIRWANIIADILLPQRASLFGYSVLFPCIWLLYQAVWKNKHRYFVYAGILAASLPMIHTHSFLAIALISAAWLLLYLHQGTRKTKNCRWYGAHCLAAFVILMCIVQYLGNKGLLTSPHFMAIGVSGIVCCILYGIYLLYRYIKLNKYKKIISTWGVYLLITVVLALPQLMFWTFGQVAEGGFLRGHFNWGNKGDFYPWFYIKNMGIPLLLIIGAICTGSTKSRKLILPAAVIWFVAEFILFTPNTYDNNKLLYVAYLLLCVAAADFAGDLFLKIKSRKKGKFAALGAACCCVFLCTFSALLTLGREAVSSYQLYSQAHLELAEYAENNIEANDVILTNTRHNNEIVSLAGRSTVCGSDIFLYFHGIDTTQRRADLALMYQQPSENAKLFEQYNVSYVVISSWERSEYSVDERYFEANFEKVFSRDGVDLYRIR